MFYDKQNLKNVNYRESVIIPVKRKLPPSSDYEVLQKKKEIFFIEIAFLVNVTNNLQSSCISTQAYLMYQYSKFSFLK